MTSAAPLDDDCFRHDRDRLRHAEALALIADRLGPVVGDEAVPAGEADGRVLAADVVAPRPVPGQDNAAVDGFAYAHGDGLVLRVTARLAAGDAAGRIGAGEAARIFTGAPMPRGADTVAMQEDCALDGDALAVPNLKPGANRRRAGEDVPEGAVVARAGTVLRPQDVAAIASTGAGEVAVRERLRVALLSTGSELIAPGAPYRAGGVYDSNRPMLRAILSRLGCAVTDLGALPDDRAAIERALRDAARSHHAVVTSGGASKGEEDHLLASLDALGRRHLWQLAVKPGRPMMMGQIGGTAVLGLPGNPVAAMVCALLYLRPALARLGGAVVPDPTRYALPAAFAIRSKPDRREFLRGWVEGGRAVKFGRDGSGLITGLTRARGLIEVPEATVRVEEGDPVAFIPFSELGVA